MSSKPLKLLILCCLLVTGGNSVAQSPASAVQRLSILLRLYHEHRLSDTAYLKAVDSIAPLMPGPRMAKYKYLCHLWDFEKERFLGHFEAADGLLQDAIGE